MQKNALEPRFPRPTERIVIRGRPRLKGDRIGTPADITRSAIGKTVTVARYGTWRTDPVCVILGRDSTRKAGTSGYDLALVTTDLDATPEEIIARYAARWSIDVTFFDVKNISASGKPATESARPSSGPSPSDCHILVIVWYAQYGHPATDTAGPPGRGQRDPCLAPSTPDEMS